MERALRRSRCTCTRKRSLFQALLAPHRAKAGKRTSITREIPTNSSSSRAQTCRRTMVRGGIMAKQKNKWTNEKKDIPTRRARIRRSVWPGGQCRPYSDTSKPWRSCPSRKRRPDLDPGAASRKPDRVNWRRLQTVWSPADTTGKI